ncbi:MAG TPA: protein-glutamate O-methyltransferase CheR [Stenomitos sp.]
MTAPFHPPGQGSKFAPSDLIDFKRRLFPLIGFNLEGFKERQLERRLTALMFKAGVQTLSDYHDYLLADPERLQALVEGLTINVSEFFRDPETFEELKRSILPELLSRFDRLRIWSAGCSIGAELYSVGMILDELGALDRCDLVGTDLDGRILERALEGLYLPNEVRDVAPDRLARYFEAEEGRYRFRGEAIRARCRFLRHNLFQDPEQSGWHLILCRNVVIYFHDRSKKRLFQAFYGALEPGGVYFVGRSERILEAHQYGFRLVQPFFYQRPRTGSATRSRS